MKVSLILARLLRLHRSIGTEFIQFFHQSINLKILAPFRHAYTIRHKPKLAFLTKLRKLMLHFRPQFCSVAACGCASPIPEAPLLVLAQPLPELVGRRRSCFSFPSARKSASIPRVPQEAVMWSGLTELLCPTACQLPLAYSWLQGISRDLSFLYTFLCLDGICRS